LVVAYPTGFNFNKYHDKEIKKALEISTSTHLFGCRLGHITFFLVGKKRPNRANYVWINIGYPIANPCLLFRKK
jgi:hypothetical protein